MQLSKTPQITFGIKHSPLLGQLKPVTPPRRIERQNTHEVTNPSTNLSQRPDLNGIKENRSAHDLNEVEQITQTNNDEEHEQRFSGIHHTHVTHLRHENDVRSTTVTPEPVQETLTQEIVWIPEKPVGRRGSYTIEKSDGSGFTERYQNSEVVPVENGVIRTAERGERGGTCSEERSSELIKADGYEQSVVKNVKNANAHERNQKATEEVRTDTDVQHLPNGGIAKTTTTTTVRRVGTADRTANASTTVTRTATAVTSRDIGVK